MSLATSPAGLDRAASTASAARRRSRTTRSSASATRSTRRRRSPWHHRYAFASWSDGGAEAHTVTVPADRPERSPPRFQPDAAPRPASSPPTASTRAAARRSTDAPGHGHTGTLTGPTWSAAGRNGGALSFDGVNDCVRINDHAELDLTTGDDARGVGEPDRARQRVADGDVQGAGRAHDVRAVRQHRHRPADRAGATSAASATRAARPRRRRRLDAPRRHLRRRHRCGCTSTAPRSARSPRRADDRLDRAAEARRQRDLGRVVRRR